MNQYRTLIANMDAYRTKEQGTFYMTVLKNKTIYGGNERTLSAASRQNPNQN